MKTVTMRLQCICYKLWKKKKFAAVTQAGSCGGGGVLLPKSYMDVPAGPRKSYFLIYTNFLPGNFPPISIPFSKEKHPSFDKIGCFLQEFLQKFAAVTQAGGGGVLLPKSYMDVPAGPRKSYFLILIFCLAISHPSVYHFRKKSTQVLTKLGAFYKNLP